MTPKTKTRITFDFTFEVKGERRKSYEKLVQILCPARWGSGIDIAGFMNKSHALLFDLIVRRAIVIDECEYELQEPPADSETARSIKSLLGKKRIHPVLRDMAALLDHEPFEASEHYRNTIYLPNLKAFVRADGMKPEYIVGMLLLDGCDKIILFPYFPLDGKSAYYEVMLAIPKEDLVEHLRRLHERQVEEMNEEVNQAVRRSIEGYSRATLRLENKSDWETVEQVTYRAFRDAPPTGDGDGMEALLARNLRNRPAFVPELDYVAEIDGKIVGNIMYARSKIANDDGSVWETLTFGPVSVLPKHQREGVGSALIRRSLYTARELGYRAVLIYGHVSYYPRFGFRPSSEFGITTADGKNFPAFMALPLYDGALDGIQGRFILDDAYTTLDREKSDKLNAKLAGPMDVDEYIEALPEHIQQDVQMVRLMILLRMQIHDATEKISWSMPTYWRGRNLFHFAAHKNHLGIYPGAEAIEHFAPKLAKCKTSKGAIQFPYKGLIGEHLNLITEIAAWCAEHGMEQTED